MEHVGAAAACDATVQPGASIQSAVNDAASGDTVCIEPGTYTGTVSIGKPLTLQGADRESVVIDVSGTNQRGISVKAASGSSAPIDGVTIRSLTVNGPGSGASFGIHVFNVKDLLVEDVTVQGSSRSELDVHGVQDAIIRDSAFLGHDTAGTGFQVSDSHGVLVQNVHTSGNNWGGMAVFAGGCCMPVKGTSGVTIAPGSQSDEVVGFYTQTHQGAAIVDLDTGDFRYRVDADLPTTHVFYFKDEAAALAYAAGLPGGSVRDLETGAYLVGPGMSLAKAVQLAPSGGRIEVRAGSYELAATLSLPRAITLVGPNEGVDPTGDGGRGAEAVITSADPANPVRRALRVATEEPGVTIAGFTFENAGTAIWVNGADHVQDLTIGHNVFKENREAFGSSAAAPQHPNRIDGLVFQNNLVENNTGRTFSHYTGVRGADFDLRENEVRDSPGFYLGFVDGGNVSDNTVSTASSGIFLADDIGSMRIAGNAVSGSGAGTGVYVWEKTNFLDAVEVSGNTFTGLAVGIRVNQGDNLTTDVTNWSVRYNVFAGNEAGVTNDGTGVLDARFNWWNDVSGPFGLGDTAGPLGAVQVTPWCLVASCTAMQSVDGPLGAATDGLPV